MYYASIALHGSGLTNQIFSLIKSIIIAHKQNYKVIVVDHFLNDYEKNNYTPISQIFNIDKINIFLKNNYDIIIIDKYDIRNIELSYVKYGTDQINIDLTHSFKEKFKDNGLFIQKNTILNDIHGDPCPGVTKNLFISYTINNYIIEEKYNEYLQENICINILNSEYKNNFWWIHTNNNNMFEKILMNIEYTNHFIDKSQQIMLKNINGNDKVNIIHLRLEDDSINHWSKMNHMTKTEFKIYIENKYIKLITLYINKNDNNIILSQSLSNRVIDYLKENNYKYIFSDKFFEDREKNAIVDLLLYKKCNNTFIGNFHPEYLNGSTFSYYISVLLKSNIKQILVDLDNISHDECIYYR